MNRIKWSITYFLCGIAVGLVISVIGGSLIATPKQIASHLSPGIFLPSYFPGMRHGYYVQKNAASGILYGLCGSLGAMLGWAIYSTLVHSLG
jgi:drug/metabolite transporter (DMT)-like permease